MSGRRFAISIGCALILGWVAISAAQQPTPTPALDRRGKPLPFGVPAGTANTALPLDRIHGPVLIVTGAEPLDIAFGSGKSTFERIDHVPVFYGWRDNLQHIGTYGAADGGELGQIAWKWLDWTTRGNQAAARAFVGPACSLCTDPAWHISRKRIDKKS